MNHAGQIGVLQPLGRLQNQVGGQVQRQGAVILHELMQVHPLDVFHGNVIGVPRLVEIINDNDVGMR